MGSNLGVKYDLILATQSISPNMARNVVQTSRGVLGTGSFRKKEGLIPRQHLVVAELFEGRWLVGTHFRRWRQPKDLNKKNPARMSPFSAVHGGQYDAKYVKWECTGILHAAIVANTVRGVLLERARTNMILGCSSTTAVYITRCVYGACKIILAAVLAYAGPFAFTNPLLVETLSDKHARTWSRAPLYSYSRREARHLP